ncbi:MAG: isopentenyl-diphosphate Delta-isomerase [Alphaproteobacteria bacterium]|nr:isopentenyl-diphosphate Delta-isomerase [Alphaproteobacteria bacterium]MBT5389598.1 isopentenyl-diphosphate Delta-isomerase [Alphaproteobacteria bacterium]MBT5540646.1 isopentenyl-diphosphate Delta-isomerase [Alphaproteobacteria bacterium]MBT5654547.1 isopentenyl-diphosphate Delta-isomerase [Alphaproteobacteria bacterium]
MKTNEQLILVDEQDSPTGEMEKIEAHEKGLQHRAFSILIYNKHGEVLLQKRNPNKYHSGGLWTNTCCGHPRPHERTEQAAHRRLQEEMGFQCPLKHEFVTYYKVDLDNGLTENEIVHFYAGTFEGDFTINPDEVEEWTWLRLSDFKNNILQSKDYSYWFSFYLQKHWDHLCRLEQSYKCSPLEKA